MNNCPNCNGPMIQGFSSSYCKNECDLRRGSDVTINIDNTITLYISFDFDNTMNHSIVQEMKSLRKLTGYDCFLFSKTLDKLKRETHSWALNRRNADFRYFEITFNVGTFPSHVKDSYEDQDSLTIVLLKDQEFISIEEVF